MNECVWPKKAGQVLAPMAAEAQDGSKGGTEAQEELWKSTSTRRLRIVQGRANGETQNGIASIGNPSIRGDECVCGEEENEDKRREAS